MANNCLVTKLKETVDNNNLLMLGELKVVITDDTTWWFNQQFGIENKLRVISGNLTINGETEITISGSTGNTVKLDFVGSGVVGVSNKYELASTAFTNAKHRIDINELIYCDKLTTIENSFSGILTASPNWPNVTSIKILTGAWSATVSMLLGKITQSNLKTFRLYSVSESYVTGILSDFANALNTDVSGTEITLDMGIGGSIKDFVLAKRALGKTTGSLKFWYPQYSTVTIDGEQAIPEGEACVIEWASNNTTTVTVGSTVITINA